MHRPTHLERPASSHYSRLLPRGRHFSAPQFRFAAFLGSAARCCGPSTSERAWPTASPLSGSLRAPRRFDARSASNPPKTALPACCGRVGRAVTPPPRPAPGAPSRQRPWSLLWLQVCSGFLFSLPEGANQVFEACCLESPSTPAASRSRYRQHPPPSVPPTHSPAPRALRAPAPPAAQAEAWHQGRQGRGHAALKEPRQPAAGERSHGRAPGQICNLIAACGLQRRLRARAHTFRVRIWPGGFLEGLRGCLCSRQEAPALVRRRSAL